MLQEQVKNTIKAIGMAELVHPIFYHCPIGLRYEIGNPASDIYNGNILSSKYVQDAIDRVTRLFRNSQCQFDILLWDMYPLDIGYTPNQLQKFMDLMQLIPPQEQISAKVYLNDDMGDPTEKISCYWDLQLLHLDVTKLFQEIITADLGGFTELASSVYLFDTKNNVLFYLYDDRGLDIVAQKKESLYHLYKNYNSWILDFDRKQINEIFAE